MRNNREDNEGSLAVFQFARNVNYGCHVAMPEY